MTTLLPVEPPPRSNVVSTITNQLSPIWDWGATALRIRIVLLAEMDGVHEAERAKALRERAMQRSILSQSQCKRARLSKLPKELQAAGDASIMRKSARAKTPHLFVFPGRLRLEALRDSAELGQLDHLDTANPVLYVNFPQGRLKLFGTIIYPEQKYFAVNLPSRSTPTFAGSFSSIVVFSSYAWIGTKESNAAEKSLPFPSDLFPEEADLTNVKKAKMEKGKIWEAIPSKAKSFTETNNDSKMSLKNLNRVPSLPTMPAGSKQTLRENAEIGEENPPEVKVVASPQEERTKEETIVLDLCGASVEEVQPIPSSDNDVISLQEAMSNIDKEMNVLFDS